MAGPAVDRGSRRPRLRLAIQLLLVGAVLVAVFAVVVPQLADYSQVWDEISELSWAELAILAALAVWNILTYVPVVVAGVPGIGWGQAFVLDQTGSTVAMTVPGGGAIAVGVTYAMLTSWGFSRAQVAASTLATGLAVNVVKLLLPVVALAGLAVAGETSAGTASAAIVGGVLFAAAVLILGAVLRSDSFARRAGAAAGRMASFVRRVFRRPPVEDWGEATVRFRRQMVDLLRRRGFALSVASFVSQTATFLVLLAALRFLGTPEGEVSWAQALAVFSVVRLASAVPILPGNVGLAELGYIGGLLLAGGKEPEVVAAVLVFRFLTFFVQIPIGAFTYLAWRRNRRWRRDVGSGPPNQDPARHAVEVGRGHGRERDER